MSCWWSAWDSACSGGSCETSLFSRLAFTVLYGLCLAAVFGFALLLDLLDSDLGAPDLFNWNTLVLIGLFLLIAIWLFPNIFPGGSIQTNVVAGVALVLIVVGLLIFLLVFMMVKATIIGRAGIIARCFIASSNRSCATMPMRSGI